MVFLIQHTQSQDTEAMHLKLDELIRAVRGAHAQLIDIEEAREDEMEKIRARYRDLARHVGHELIGDESEGDASPGDPAD